MRKNIYIVCVIFLILGLAACSTAYKAKPLPFKAPAAYPNVQEVGGALVGAKAYVDSGEAKKVFGFNCPGSGHAARSGRV